MKNQDTRFVKLQEYHEEQLTHCYVSGSTGEKEDTSKDSPRYGCFYDEQEPEWMAPVDGHTRLGMYEEVIYGGSSILSYPTKYFRAKCMFYGGALGLLNIATFIGAEFLPVPLDKLAYVGVTIMNIPAAAYTSYLYCQGINEEQRLVERVEHYKDKSMQYILREAHTRKYNPWTPYTPAPVESGPEHTRFQL